VWAIAENLECLLLGRPLTQHEPPASIELSPEQLGAYAGEYTSRDGRVVASVADGALELGFEGQAVLDAFGAASPLWPVAPDSFAEEALAILQAVTKGDAEPLRKRMAPHIPRSWPDQVRDQHWPAYEREHGPLKSMRVLGAAARGLRIEVVLALEHAESPGRVRIAFSQSGLEILDWNGPQFPATARFVPVGGEAFEQFRWTSSVPCKFARKGKRVSGLAVAGLKLERR
jgi:hypothetical protein